MTASKKYLYGKLLNLSNFLRNGNPLWFRDIYSLNMLENKVICDEESIRNFKIDSKHITKITFDGHDFNLAPNSILRMSQPTRRCYVLCMSKKGNNTELFKRFNADICVEINVELLIQLIKQNTEHFNLEVIGKDVTYYRPGNLPESIDPMELVFRKEADKYQIEDEYRIAIFWPYDNETKIMTTDGNYINIFAKNPNIDDHISLSITDINLKELVIGIRDRYGKIVNP